MFFWSPSATLPPASGSAVFSTPSLSPVSELSLTLSEKFSRMRPSATIISPASTSTISPGTTSADDFISPQRRALAQKLLDGLTPAAILEEMDDEEERSRTAKLLSSESGAGEQELRMVADYLRVLEKKRKENEIKALKEKMSTQQGEEKRGTLIKIQELLAQENKTGRRE